MGKTQLPHQLVDGEGNVPDVSQVMDNIGHVNLTPFNLIVNGDIEIWSAGTAVAPDRWTLVGAGAAVARDADEKHGDYAAKITYGAADAYLYQDAGEFAFYQGRKVKAWCWVKTATADIAKITINDGIGTTDSSFHTGDSTYQLLTVEHTMSGTADKLRLELHVVGAGNAIFDVVNLVDFHDIRGILYSSEILDVSKVKGWINLDGTGVIADDDSFNVSGITDEGVGDYTITWDVDFASVDYVVVSMLLGQYHTRAVAIATGSIRILCADSAHNAIDIDPLMVIAIGNQ